MHPSWGHIASWVVIYMGEMHPHCNRFYGRTPDSTRNGERHSFDLLWFTYCQLETWSARRNDRKQMKPASSMHMLRWLCTIHGCFLRDNWVDTLLKNGAFIPPHVAHWHWEICSLTSITTGKWNTLTLCAHWDRTVFFSIKSLNAHKCLLSPSDPFLGLVSTVGDTGHQEV